MWTVARAENKAKCNTDSSGIKYQCNISFVWAKILRLIVIYFHSPVPTVSTESTNDDEANPRLTLEFHRRYSLNHCKPYFKC